VSASPTGSWIAGTIASAADVDWYRFSLPGHRSVQYLLGGLPADYRMDVYRQCGDAQAFHYHDYQPGTQFEELILPTYSDPYMPVYVRISSASGVASSEPYGLRARIVPNGLTIMSSNSFREAAQRHIVGEVYTTGDYHGMQVTATLYDSSGDVLGMVAAPTMLQEIEWSRYRRRTPFEIVFTQPAGFDHYRVSVTGEREPVDPLGRMNLSYLSPFVDASDVGHFPGEIRNNNSFTIASLDVFVTLYNDHGRVINVAAAATGKESVGPGGKAVFDATFDRSFETWNRWRAVPQAVPAS
jgi:hypothetical protein